MVLAFIAERGTVSRSDISRSPHERVSVGHVVRSLETLLRERQIRVAGKIAQMVTDEE